MSSSAAPTTRPVPALPASAPAAVAATMGREIMICGKLTTSNPHTAPNRATGSTVTMNGLSWGSSSVTIARQQVIERNRARGGDILRGHNDAARGEAAQSPLFVLREKHVPQASARDPLGSEGRRG